MRAAAISSSRFPQDLRFRSPPPMLSSSDWVRWAALPGCAVGPRARSTDWPVAEDGAPSPPESRWGAQPASGAGAPLHPVKQARHLRPQKRYRRAASAKRRRPAKTEHRRRASFTACSGGASLRSKAPSRRPAWRRWMARAPRLSCSSRCRSKPMSPRCCRCPDTSRNHSCRCC